jgi:MFS family permease
MFLPEALRTRSFWLLNLISLCDALLVNVVTVHIVPYVITLQIDPLQAATVFSLAVGVSIPAHIGMAGFADRIGNRPVLIVCLTMSFMAFSALPFTGGMLSIYFFAVLDGIGLWTTGAVISQLIADIFGLKAHGSIFACTVFSGTIGGGLGPVLVGYLFDITGNYHPGWLLSLAASLVSLSTLLFVVSPPSYSNSVSGEKESVSQPGE